MANETPPVLTISALSELGRLPAREVLEGEYFPAFLEKQRWFGGKGRALRTVRISQSAPLSHALWLNVRVDYKEGQPEHYQVPLAYAAKNEKPDARAILAEVVKDGQSGYLIDAMSVPQFTRDLVDFMLSLSTGRQNKNAVLADGGKLEAEVSPAFRATCEGEEWQPKPLKADQSNTAVLLGKRYFFKLYRRLEAGLSPEAEIVRYLGESARFSGTPAWRGEWRLHSSARESTALALITDQVESPVSAWDYLQGKLTATPDLTATVEQDFIRTLGLRTAEMHAALAKGDTPAFKPEAYGPGETGKLARSISQQLAQALRELRGKLPGLDPETKKAAERLLDQSEALEKPLRLLSEAEPGALGLKTRTHGDYHLGQVLVHKHGVAILDFEGEPARSLAERRAKQSPLRDVAGMLRSLHYAAVAARLLPGEGFKPGAAALDAWHRQAHADYLAAYDAGMAAESLLPQGIHRRNLLAALVVEKAAYELRYEVHNRPDWVGIPLGGLIALAEG